MMDVGAVFKEKAQSLNVVVIGDVGLDTTFYGMATREAQEFHGEIFDVFEDSMPALGGSLTEYISLSMAGRLAHQVAMLGCKTTLVGRVGEDQARMNFEELCAISKIDFMPLSNGPSLVTSNKVRFKDGDQILFRADFEKVMPIGLSQDEATRLQSLCVGADLVIVSDYAKGVVSECVMIAARACDLVYVDPKPRGNNELYRDVDGMKLNRKEVQALLGRGVDNFELAAIEAMNECQVRSSVLVSGGAEPNHLALVSGLDRKRVVSLAPMAEMVRDVTGAGDVLMAFYAVGSALGVSSGDLMFYSQRASALAVETGCLVTIEEIERDQR